MDTSDVKTTTVTLSAGLNQTILNGGGEIQYLDVIDYIITSTANTLVRLYFTGNNPPLGTYQMAANSTESSTNSHHRGADDTSLLVDIVGAATVTITVRYSEMLRNRKLAM